MMDQRVIAVTGGGSGVGRALVRRLGALGHKVAALDLNEEGARLSVEGLAHGLALRMDVSNEDSVREGFAAIASSLGGVEVLINCAGVCVQKRLGDTTFADWNKVWQSNMTGTFLCAREAWAHMRASGRGHVINVVSQAAGWPGANEIAYGTAKTAQLKFTLHLNFEFDLENKIRMREGKPAGAFYAHAICPGAIDTPMNQQLGRTLPADSLLKPDEVASFVGEVLERPIRGWSDFQRNASGLRVGEIGMFSSWPTVVRVWREAAG
jgi:NAD(P)-dependent dehydrogenase (short-subunit alcohol dehydrogenase family)